MTEGLTPTTATQQERVTETPPPQDQERREATPLKDQFRNALTQLTKAIAEKEPEEQVEKLRRVTEKAAENYWEALSQVEGTPPIEKEPESIALNQQERISVRRKVTEGVGDTINDEITRTAQEYNLRLDSDEWRGWLIRSTAEQREELITAQIKEEEVVKALQERDLNSLTDNELRAIAQVFAEAREQREAIRAMIGVQLSEGVLRAMGREIIARGQELKEVFGSLRNQTFKLLVGVALVVGAVELVTGGHPSQLLELGRVIVEGTLQDADPAAGVIRMVDYIAQVASYQLKSLASPANQEQAAKVASVITSRGDHLKQLLGPTTRLAAMGLGAITMTGAWTVRKLGAVIGDLAKIRRARKNLAEAQERLEKFKQESLKRQ